LTTTIPKNYRDVDSCSNCKHCIIRTVSIKDGGLKFYCSLCQSQRHRETLIQFLKRLFMVSEGHICDNYEIRK